MDPSSSSSSKGRSKWREREREREGREGEFSRAMGSGSRRGGSDVGLGWIIYIRPILIGRGRDQLASTVWPTEKHRRTFANKYN